MGAVLFPENSFSLVRISIRDNWLQTEILTKEVQGWGWGSEIRSSENLEKLRVGLGQNPGEKLYIYIYPPPPRGRNLICPPPPSFIHPPPLEGYFQGMGGGCIKFGPAQNRFFGGFFFFLSRRIFLRISLPECFSSFMWEKAPRKILQENLWQNPPKLMQQKSPTHSCRGAGPKKKALAVRLWRGFFTGPRAHFPDLSQGKAPKIAGGRKFGHPETLSPK